MYTREEIKAQVRLKRLFRDFPWLWALQNHWAHWNSVQIESITLMRLSRDFSLSLDGGTWWVKLSSGDGLTHPLGLIKKLDLTSGAVSLATATIRSIPGIDYNKIEFLIFQSHGGRGGNLSTTIYRAPRGQNLHQMCCEAAGIRAKS
ncbi:MAG: hypothetical protein QY304_00235 [Candidatus Paceibacterota bacterium]|nr:MAG: hypothetical protein QY304_00235 [Candidatus Paceibacterota bacterium]